MKKILSLFMLWQCIAITSFASTDDIGLYVNDIILDWSGGGGTKDVVNNSLTSNQSAINYWDIHDLSTDIYEKLEISFAQVVDYDNINITITYSDGSTIETKILRGTSSHEVNFDASVESNSKCKIKVKN